MEPVLVSSEAEAGGIHHLGPRCPFGPAPHALLISTGFTEGLWYRKELETKHLFFLVFVLSVFSLESISPL